MILQCSECQARFLVPDTALGPEGRTVRCGRCRHTWFQTPSANFSNQLLNDLEKLIHDVNAKPLPPGSNLPVVRRDFAPIRTMLAAVTLSAGAAAMILLVMFPGVLGFPRSTGIALADVGMTRLIEDKHTAYDINGKIANTSGKPVRTPALRVTLVDDHGAALQYWDFAGDGKIIEAGQSVPFDTGKLEVGFSRASRFVVDVGNALELALRRKPE